MPFGVVERIKSADALTFGDWGCEIIPSMAPVEGDLIHPKYGMCAFSSTDLDSDLRSRGIQNVIVVGFLTNGSVESTIRTAYERCYNVYVLPECCAACSMEEHVFSIVSKTAARNHLKILCHQNGSHSIELFLCFLYCIRNCVLFNRVSAFLLENPASVVTSRLSSSDSHFLLLSFILIRFALQFTMHLVHRSKLWNVCYPCQWSCHDERVEWRLWRRIRRGRRVRRS